MEAISIPTYNMSIPIYNTSINETILEFINMIINETAVNISHQDIRDQIKKFNLYLYGTPPLIIFCLASICININVLLSMFWIRRPFSPTLHISLSLAGADAFSSSALGLGLIMNSFIPNVFEIRFDDMGCFLLALEVVRLGGIIVTVFHLMALALNHYLGILKPFHYPSIMTSRVITIILVLLWVLPISFFGVYFNSIENEGFQSEGCNKNTFLLHKEFRLMFSNLFFIPFGLMICIYIHIFFLVKKHLAKREQYKRASEFVHKKKAETMRVKHRRIKHNIKTMQTTLYILGSFVIGWMPAVIVFMLVCTDCMLQFKGMSFDIQFSINAIVNALVILKTMVNPIIYGNRMHEVQMAKQQMRNDFKKWITSIYWFIRMFFTDRRINRMNSNKKSNQHSQSTICTGQLIYKISVRQTRNRSMRMCANICEYADTPV